MTCHEAQTSASLYLYGELDFAQEEEFERHLDECALCQRTLDREKLWHTALKSDGAGVPLELLSGCRQDLHMALAGVVHRTSEPWWDGLWQRVSFSHGSLQLAMASFIFLVGFSLARWFDSNGFDNNGMDNNGVSQGFQPGATLRAGMLPGPFTTRIRGIQPDGQDRVRILLEQVRDGEVVGSIDDRGVRRLLLGATANSVDPGIRIDSVEMLVRQVSGSLSDAQDGGDIRDVLLNSVQHDPNAAVRLKALEGLRRFSNDVAARQALKFVLQNDENAGVRSEAIDILAPADPGFQVTPELAGTLQEIMRSMPDDEYVHARCQQVLHATNVSLVY